MRILKRILVVFLGLVAVFLIAALFVDKKMEIEREIVINKPVEEVFDYIVLLKNQDNFSKWALIDPNSKKSYKGTDGTVGFVSAWDSKNDDLGAGEQEILKISKNHRIDYELRFKRPMEATNQAYLVTEKAGNNTKVKWGFQGEMPYPFNLMSKLMGMKAMLEEDLDAGLKNLKGVLDK